MGGPPESSRSMRRTGWGIIAALFLIIAGVAAYFVTQPIRDAKHTEQLVNDRYGEPPAYEPPADGSVSADRIEVFLRIRQRVMRHCSAFQAVQDEALRLEQLDEDSDTPKIVFLLSFIQGIKRVTGFWPVFLRFISERNTSLLEEGMGLGEYMYIYVLAYHDQLAAVPESRNAKAPDAEISERARADLTEILRNQLAQLVSGDSVADRERLITELQAQIADLSAGRQRFPWQAGLPPGIARGFAPYGARLAELYCAGIARFELLQKNKGLSFKG